MFVLLAILNLAVFDVKKEGAVIVYGLAGIADAIVCVLICVLGSKLGG